MQLRTARLCLDCEEIHEEQQCPVCASEMFMYLSRWVPVEDRRRQRRQVVAARPAEKSPVAQWAQRGALGLAAFAVSRWLWQSTRPAQSAPTAPPRERDPGEGHETEGHKR